MRSVKPEVSVCIGLMSGTSMDGVDGVVADFSEISAGKVRILGAAHTPFPEDLRNAAAALQQSGPDEIHREALLSQRLAQVYADCVAQLRPLADEVRAVGVHGQTIRHRPELGYTRQTNHPALLAELCGLDVIADFRSRDVAAGGQGAPLVPAFHMAMFGSATETRVLANIGGISNISILPPDGAVRGFDTGPGNVLMDGWAQLHCGTPYDENGRFAASGQVNAALLDSLMREAFLQLPAPKSTGRDLFHLPWLQQHLQNLPAIAAADVQATLCAYTARTLAQAIATSAPQADAVFVCGGGAYNAELMRRLAAELAAAGCAARLSQTAELGVVPEQVEALAFAWLAYHFCEGLPGNLPAVTGAAGTRILGAWYPA
ncbi:anhydro-N-acetylmuramic acid kinase [Undibacterium squillarum]|uniref:Anhydro-N-acetylmuramic acid kinase n=1 Tax=Undibacterium squillarum TaxID=1131567 RepID=A0ABQ2Y0H4_9BURK|nr:anhydro-N-acetylmuramic acid kinase [Undibacterium squillarum]GGX45509.1 anhydro-N-acetylmuramic acid kinase [Undibacterium squillarum]